MSAPEAHELTDTPPSFTAEGEHGEVVLLTPIHELGILNLAISDDPSGTYADIVLHREVAVRLAHAILDTERSL